MGFISVVPAHGWAQWSYYVDRDELSSTATTVATVLSRNSVSLTSPVRSTTRARLTIRQQPDELPHLVFTVSNGILMCDATCDVRMKFDEENPIRWGATTNAADGSYDTMFLGGGWQFVDMVTGHKSLRIEVMFFQQGTRIFNFDLSGYQWPPDSARVKKR